MTWFRVDDGFWRSKKVRRLGRARLQVPAQVAGAGLWTLAGDWCADNLTDGFVPWEVIEDWDTRRSIAKRLIAVGLWCETEQDGEAGIQFHDWDDWQPTKDQVEQRRKADAERRAKWREARRGAPETGQSQAESRQVSRRDTPRDSRRESRPASRQGSALPDPTRPDPTRPVVSTSVGEAPPDSNARANDNHPGPRGNTPSATARGTRIRADYQPTRDDVEWARTECADVDTRRETGQMVDHYTSLAGPDGLRDDWNAVWRNWMRREQKHLQQRAGSRHLAAVPALADPGRELTNAEVDDILGIETGPQAPREVEEGDPADRHQWYLAATKAWRAERRDKARAILQRRAAGQ